MNDNDIPEKYIELCRAIGRLAKEYKVRSLTASFFPGFDVPSWSEKVEMSWQSGRHYDAVDKVSITSTRHLNTTVDTEGKQP